MRSVPTPVWGAPRPANKRIGLDEIVPEYRMDNPPKFVILSETMAETLTHWHEGRTTFCPDADGMGCPVDHKWQEPRWCGFLHVLACRHFKWSEGWFKVTSYCAENCPELERLKTNLRGHEFMFYRKRNARNGARVMKYINRSALPILPPAKDLRPFVESLYLADNRPANAPKRYKP